MLDVKLPDGTWVTTSIGAGFGMPGSQCAGDTCVWEDVGPPTPLEIMPAGAVPVQMQRCTRCGWVRGKYLGNPHPEDDLPEADLLEMDF